MDPNYAGERIESYVLNTGNIGCLLERGLCNDTCVRFCGILISKVEHFGRVSDEQTKMVAKRVRMKL